MNIPRLFQIILIITVTATSNACASKSIAPWGFNGTQAKLDSSFWKNATARILIGVTPYPIIGQTFNLRRGPDTAILGINDERVTDLLNSGLTDFVRNFDYSEMLNIKTIFAQELTKRNMQVLLLNDKNLEAQYQDFIINKASRDSVSKFRDRNDADYLILFQITKCGIVNKGDFFTGYRLRGTLGLVAYLIDLHDASIEWKFFQSGLQVPVSGEWNQPPNYPAVATAIHEAITLTTIKLTESFFN